MGKSCLMLYFEEQKRLVKVKDVAFEFSDDLLNALGNQFGVNNVAKKARAK